MSFIEAVAHKARQNRFWQEDGVMNVQFFYPLSLPSLIFCQHKLWMITHGEKKEAEREVILLAACMSGNLFCGPSGFSHTLKAALLNASRLALKCCFIHAFLEKQSASVTKSSCLCLLLCLCVCVYMCAHAFCFCLRTRTIYQKSPVFPEVEKAMLFHHKLLRIQTQVNIEPLPWRTSLQPQKIDISQIELYHQQYVFMIISDEMTPVS